MAVKKTMINMTSTGRKRTEARAKKTKERKQSPDAKLKRSEAMRSEERCKN